MSIRTKAMPLQYRNCPKAKAKIMPDGFLTQRLQRFGDVVEFVDRKFLEQR
jgi:hypothetical protein